MVLKNQNIDLIIRYAGIMILLTFAGLLEEQEAEYFQQWLHKLRVLTYEKTYSKKVQSWSFKNIDELETGHLITRLTNDVVQIQQFLTCYLD